MKLKVFLLLILGTMTLSSCDWLFGQHNEAAAQGRNLEDDRVYGDKGGEPRQLNNQYSGYEATDEDLERTRKIREKLYGEKEAEEEMATPAPTEEADSTQVVEE
ncbi:MAG: hypothetical protein AAF740_11790 [Bacteroidota bacterium]